MATMKSINKDAVLRINGHNEGHSCRRTPNGSDEVYYGSIVSGERRKNLAQIETLRGL